MPGRYNFTIEQGATFRKTITWKDATGNPVPLTDYSGKMQLRDKVGGTDYFELNSEHDGGITFNPSLGQVFLYISDTNTKTLTQSRYVYDLDLTSPTGDVIRLLKGRIHIDPGVTE